MANSRRGNIHFVDTAATITTTRNVKVTNIIITATNNNAVVVIQDPLDSSDIMDLRVASTHDVSQFPFLHAPLTFPNGIKVSTLTNAKVMFVYHEG